ncbi:MAG: STAS domain-containing protein [candidate division WS1 bacterium]|jgi:anti-sigma B factor antagonist|nr:STAS domain-containing protein [candidate division WS1 bacterium]
MKADLQVHDQVARLTVIGELDAYSAPQVRDRLVEALENDARWVVVDLRKTEFIDSFFLTILMGAGKRAGGKCGDIIVVCDASHLLQIFDRSGTTELLNVVPTMEEAEQLLYDWRASDQQPEEGQS